jgi:hypothetical protein
MATTVKTTMGEILNAPRIGSWDKYCEKNGVNPYCINEGRAESNTEVEISVEEALDYGLIKRSVDPK